jgi:YD repeat-containing protein
MNVCVLLTALVAGVSNFTGPAAAQRVRAIDLPITPGSDYSADTLRGNVKSVVTESARFGKSEGRWVEGGRFVVGKAAYGENGAMTESSRYLADGTLASKATCKLDSDGRVVERLVYAAGASTPSSKESFTYGDKGQVTEAARLGKYDNVEEKYTFKYDEEGRLTEQAAFATEGSDTYRTALSYDANGNLISQITYDRSGEVETTMLYAYGADGKKISQKLFHPRNKHVYTKQFTYDSKGDVAKEVTYAGDGRLQSRHTYRYTYDDRGNWTKRVTYDTRAFKPVWLMVTYRTIGYYGE